LTSNYNVKVSSVLIGSVTLTGVMYVAERLVGSGPGGRHLSPRTVANTIMPVGIVGHHKWWEIIVALDEDDRAALFDTAIVAQTTDNPPMIALVVTRKDAGGKTQTVTYQATSYCFVADYGGRITNEENNQPYEVTFICIGTRTPSAWA
jgi:hypothetical protein